MKTLYNSINKQTNFVNLNTLRQTLKHRTKFFLEHNGVHSQQSPRRPHDFGSKKNLVRCEKGILLTGDHHKISQIK